MAKELNRYSDAAVMTDVQLFKSHPQAIRALRLLFPPPPGQPRVASGKLVITHTTGPGGTDSRIMLTEGQPDEGFSSRAETLDVTPLPPEWQPAKW